MATRRGPDGSVRTAVTGKIVTEPFANVFWCNLTGGTTASQADLDAWTTAFRNAYVTNFGPKTGQQITIQNASSVLFQPGNTALHSTSVGSTTGTGGVTLVSNYATSRVVSWTSSVYWRGGKPRTYLPGVVSTETADGQTISAGTITALVTAALAFRTAVNALTSGGITGTQFGFCSFMSGGVELEPGVFHPITGAQVHPRFGTQRTRLGPWKP